MKRLIAVVCSTPLLGAADFNRGVAAVQRQVSEHFFPIWDNDAIVQGFTHFAQVPADYGIISIETSSEVLTERVPLEKMICKIVLSDNWTFELSQVVLNITANPYNIEFKCNSTHLFCVNVCSPVGASEYEIDGIKVSDFIKPTYYDKLPNEKTFKNSDATQLRRGGWIFSFDVALNKWTLQYFFNDVIEKTFLNASSSNGINAVMVVLNEFLESKRDERIKALQEERYAISYMKRFA